MELLALLTSVLLLAKQVQLQNYEQEPDRFQLEQEEEPGRFRLEQGPDRFHLEQDQNRFHLEQGPDYRQEQGPDYRQEQGPNNRLEQGPDYRESHQFRQEQSDDGTPIQQAVKKHPLMENARTEGDAFELRVTKEDEDDFLNKLVMMQKEGHTNPKKPKATFQGKNLDGFKTILQGKNLDGFRSTMMGEDDGDDRNMLDELAKLQKEGHTNPKKPKKVTFEENVNMKALVERVTKGEGLKSENEQDDDDDALSQWVMVTAEGYEYTAAQDEMKEVFSKAAKAVAETSGYTESSFDAGEEQMRVQASINASSQRVLGSDSRYLVRYPWYYPYAAMGRMQTGCTGTFIGPRHILTAGHCVFNPYTGKWNRNLDIQRRKNCDPDPGVHYKWKYAVTVWGWIYGYRSYNYAVIVVTKSSPTWMGFGWKNPMPRYYVTTAGYPYDKSPRQCMWRSNGYLGWRGHNLMLHYCDTNIGMSGGPIYVGYRIYGIHIGAFGYRYNVAMRINKRRFYTLQYIMKKYK